MNQDDGLKPSDVHHVVRTSHKSSALFEAGPLDYAAYTHPLQVIYSTKTSEASTCDKESSQTSTEELHPDF